MASPSEIMNSLAYLLSLLTISSCLILKVPQILKVAELQSTEGLSETGLMIEMYSYTVTALYNYCNNYNLLTYLEYPIIMTQEAVLIALVLFYGNLLEELYIRVFIIAYFMICSGFLSGVLPTEILTYVIPLTTPLGAISKILQVKTMIETKNAENVSLGTWIISAATNAFRIFTVYVDSADTNLLINFGVSTALSTSVLLTAMYYKKYGPSYRRHAITN